MIFFFSYKGTALGKKKLERVVEQIQRSLFHGGIDSHWKLHRLDFQQLQNTLDMYTHHKHPLTSEVTFQFTFEKDLKVHSYIHKVN